MNVIAQYDPYARMGNRMFQYAFGYILAKKGKKEFIHDALPNFGISASMDSPSTLATVDNKGKLIAYEPVIRTLQTWGEGQVDMDLLINHKGSIVINSYVQKSSYYKEHRDLLRETFGIKQMDTINKDCLVVHIRETDYVEINSFLGYDYYKALINDSGFTKIKIITDNSNCDTVDRLANEGCEVVTEGYVDKFEHHSNKRSMSDFKTLLYSENIALSQSSFSWWAAFLGYHKKIIFPFSTKVKMWPVEPGKDDVDLYFDFNGESTKYVL
jgi:hypothetical protein